MASACSCPPLWCEPFPDRPYHSRRSAGGGLAVIPTEAAIDAMERARWLPDPETQAALNFIITILSQPESDGLNKLERIYLTCKFEEQRNREVETAAFAFLQKRFRREYAVFTADCADHGRARFKLRIGESHADLAKCIPATGEVMLNLMKPHDEWISGPKTELRLVDKVGNAPPPKAVPEAKPQRAKVSRPTVAKK